MKSIQGIENLPSFDSWKDDFSANYGGTARKSGLIGADGTRHLVKYAKKNACRNDLTTSHANNTISEYVASHIFNILAYPAQETRLGTLHGEIIVLCRNFVPQGAVLIEFEKFMRRHYNSCAIGKEPDVAQIYEVLEKDPQLSPQAAQFKSLYWELFIGDALVGNFNRHQENFGYVVEADNSIKMSPVYANDKAFYPNLSEGDMQAVLANSDGIIKLIKSFPNAALKRRGRKIGFYDAMASGIYDELSTAVVSTFPRICAAMPKVYGFIDECVFLSDTRKIFYKSTLAARLQLILEPAFRICVSQEFDLKARKRILEGS